MISGLRVTITGMDLYARISERMQVHFDKQRALDARIQKREGDAAFDVRVEDGLETLGELQEESERHGARVRELTLLCDGLNVDEIYSLGVADLRAADLLQSNDSIEHAETELTPPESARPPVDGLKLTIPGPRVRALLDDAIARHRACAARWRREAARTAEEQTPDEPLLPDEMCENEAERHEWRADVLGFLREHLDASEVYRLGEHDLVFGELLPPKPGFVEQDEYEERNRVGFAMDGWLGTAGSADGLTFRDPPLPPPPPSPSAGAARDAVEE